VQFLVEGDVVDELSDKRGDILAFPLRSHVANTVNGSECESAVVLEITWEVAISSPGCPVLRYLPVLLPDPFSSAQGCNSAISVTWVMHNAVAICVAQHNIVDPDGGLAEGAVSWIHGVVAVSECRNVIRNIELLSDVLPLKVSSHKVLQCTWWLQVVPLISMRESVPLVHETGIGVLSPIQVIDVEVSDKVHDLVVEAGALRRVVDLHVHLVPIVDTAQRYDLVVQILRDHAPVGQRLDELVVWIYVHICDTVTDDEALEVVGVIALVHLLLEVPLVYLPGEVRPIHAGIALASHVQGIIPLLGESLVELLKCGEGILTLRQIRVKQVSCCVGHGETDTRWALNVQ
jgi:hypothetical protein